TAWPAIAIGAAAVPAKSAGEQLGAGISCAPRSSTTSVVMACVSTRDQHTVSRVEAPEESAHLSATVRVESYSMGGRRRRGPIEPASIAGLAAAIAVASCFTQLREIRPG